MFRNYKSLQNKLWKAEADSRGRRGWGGCPPLLTGCILKQVKIMLQNA